MSAGRDNLDAEQIFAKRDSAFAATYRCQFPLPLTVEHCLL